MKSNIFISPLKIITERGGISNVGFYSKDLGKKALICVGGSSARKSGSLDKAITSLAKEGIGHAVYEGIPSDPDIESVLKGLEVCKKEGCDFIVALGGGSVIDAAKAIGLIFNNGGEVSYYEKNKPSKRMLPMIAVPTTAGTASEVTMYSIITDNSQKRKMVISCEEILPDIALLDAELTISTPPSVAAATGMDALTHAIESYISDRATPTTRLFALKAIEMIMGSIHCAVYNPKNIDAKENMIVAQMYAGMAFSNTSTALVHSMSRPLGVHFGVPHGEGNAVLLSTVMEFNMPTCVEEFSQIAKAAGLEPATGGKVGYADAFLCELRRIHENLPLRKDLKDLNITEKDLDEMGQVALASGSTGVNPRKPSLSEIKELFKKLM